MRCLSSTLGELLDAHEQAFTHFGGYTQEHLYNRRRTVCAPRAILETFATLQIVDVHLPTTDGRQLVLPRHTRPNREHDLLLHQLILQLPTQPAPRITA